MYILELIAKLIKNKKIKSQSEELKWEEETCEHVFLPIDSTGDVLACSKCGFVIKKKDLKIKPKNPFD